MFAVFHPSLVFASKMLFIKTPASQPGCLLNPVLVLRRTKPPSIKSSDKHWNFLYISTKTILKKKEQKTKALLNDSNRCLPGWTNRYSITNGLLDVQLNINENNTTGTSSEHILKSRKKSNLQRWVSEKGWRRFTISADRPIFTVGTNSNVGCWDIS